MEMYAVSWRLCGRRQTLISCLWKTYLQTNLTFYKHLLNAFYVSATGLGPKKTVKRPAHGAYILVETNIDSINEKTKEWGEDWVTGAGALNYPEKSPK